MLYLVLEALDPRFVWKSLSFLDLESVLLIAAFMTISRAMEFSGIFTRLIRWMISTTGGSPRKLILLMTLSTALASALVMNDTAMFIFVPMVVSLARLLEADCPLLVAFSAIAANGGSALTPIGNPQNIIIWRSYGVSFSEFVIWMIPFWGISLGLLILFELLMIKHLRTVSTGLVPSVKLKRGLIAASLILLPVDVILVQMNMGIPASLLTVAAFLILSKEAVLSVDVGLMAVFAFMFMDFRELSYLVSRYGLLSNIRGPIDVMIASALLSQVVSNVPATIMLTHLHRCWQALAVGANLGGSGLIVGSLANLIAVRISGTSMKSFMKISIPFFILSLLLVVPVYWLILPVS